MCYDVKVVLERQLKVAHQIGDAAVIDELEKRILPMLEPNERCYYRVSGFDHPRLLLLTGERNELVPKLAQWGLIPPFVREANLVAEYANKTLNCRMESMLEKASFKDSCLSGRSILSVDGFYEHQHRCGRTYPYFISKQEDEPLLLATLAAKADKNVHRLTGELTFSIVTTKAFGLMAEIHNNPKLKEARMPLMVKGNRVKDWLNESLHEKELKELMSEVINDQKHIQIKAHTVRPFSRNSSASNDSRSADFFSYPELQKGLFD